MMSDAAMSCEHTPCIQLFIYAHVFVELLQAQASELLQLTTASRLQTLCATELSVLRIQMFVVTTLGLDAA